MKRIYRWLNKKSYFNVGDRVMSLTPLSRGKVPSNMRGVVLDVDPRNEELLLVHFANGLEVWVRATDLEWLPHWGPLREIKV